MVDYSGLENRRAERHRGFESLSLRKTRCNAAGFSVYSLSDSRFSETKKEYLVTVIGSASGGFLFVFCVICKVILTLVQKENALLSDNPTLSCAVLVLIPKISNILGL